MARDAIRRGPGLETKNPEIWLLQDGEPLPFDGGAPVMRTAHLASKLRELGVSVKWWASAFDHRLKQYHQVRENPVQLDRGYSIFLLNGPPYAKNLSLARIRHYRSLAAAYSRMTESVPPPSLILGSYPSPELCEAGLLTALRHRVPFVVDIRDTWPDLFPDYFPRAMRWALWPLLWYYRKKIRFVTRASRGIVSVSDAMLRWGLGYAGRAPNDFDSVFHIGYPKPVAARAFSLPSHFSEAQPLVCLFATTCGRSYDGISLIQAARILEMRGERRARFVITGNGEMRSRWMKLASGLGTVLFPGWINNREWLVKSHVGLILLQEGLARYWLGNKFFEYLSADLALINNVSGECSDLIFRHRIGWNVPPRRPERLADLIEQLIANPGLLQDTIANSGRTFAQMFDRDQISERYALFVLGHLSHHEEPGGSCRDVAMSGRALVERAGPVRTAGRDE
ncbi:MAG: glycosyltransferase [Acidobacteriota bacterium]